MPSTRALELGLLECSDGSAEQWRFVIVVGQQGTSCLAWQFDVCVPRVCNKYLKYKEPITSFQRVFSL